MDNTITEPLARDFVALHPAEAARVLARLPTLEASAFMESFPPQEAAKVARHLTAQEAADCLRGLPAGQVGSVLTELPRDQAAAILRRLEREEREHIVAALPDLWRRSLTKLLRYEESSAGAWMEPLVLAISEDLSAASALETVRRNSDQVRYYVYVVDRDERLVGVVDLRTLLCADPDDAVARLMRRDLHRISARAGREATLRHPGWREVHALPVIAEDNSLLGVLRYETVQRLARSEEHRAPSSAATDALGELYWLGSKRVFDEFLQLASEGRRDDPIA